MFDFSLSEFDNVHQLLEAVRGSEETIRLILLGTKLDENGETGGRYRTTWRIKEIQWDTDRGMHMVEAEKGPSDDPAACDRISVPRHLSVPRHQCVVAGRNVYAHEFYHEQVDGGDAHREVGRSEDLDRLDPKDPDQLEDLLEQYQCDFGSKDLGVYEVYYLTQYRRSDTDRPDERFSTMYYDRDSLLEDLVDGKIRWSDWNPFRE